MRITNSMIVNNFMRNLNSNLVKMDGFQNKLATGRKFANISDDPSALIYSQSARNNIARLSHYERAVTTAQDWLEQVETGIMQLQNTLADAYVETVNAATDVKTAADRQNIGAVIGQLRDHSINILNTTFGDKYIFGSYNTPGDSNTGEITGPFVVDGSGNLTYNGLNLSQFDGMDFDDFVRITNPNNLSTLTDPDEISLNILMNDLLTFDVGPSISMPVTMTGIDLMFFQTTDENGNIIMRNSFNVLSELYDASMKPNSTALDVNVYIRPLLDGQSHLLTKTAEIGGRTRRLELIAARYEQDTINYNRMKSDAEDVDFAEVIIHQKMAEAVYQAALSTGARIIQPTLMDFLR